MTSIAEVIPLVRHAVTLAEISQAIGRSCVFINEYHYSTRLEESCDFNITNCLTIKVISTDISYYILKINFDYRDMFAYEYLEDNNVFDLDIDNIAKKWEDTGLRRFDISSDSNREYYQDRDFLNLVATLADKYEGVISINEFMPKIPGYLYSVEEWRKLIESLKQ